MILKVEKSFLKDIDKINDKSLLINLKELIVSLNKAKSQSEISNLNKLSGKKIISVLELEIID